MDKKKRFKQIIKHLESSSGKNMDHDTINSGINSGQTAGGAYGIVPNSLKDFVGQARNRNYILPEDLSNVKDLSDEEITERLNTDRQFDEDAADLGSELLLQKAGQDESKAAKGWRRGHNQSFKRLDEKKLMEDPYVRAYRKIASEQAMDDPEVKEERFQKLRQYFNKGE